MLALPENAINQALKYGKIFTFSNNEVIHARGDKSAGLSIVENGQVKFGNYGLDGQYRLTRIMNRGETFGEFTLFANLPRTHTAESCGESRVLTLSHSGFSALCDDYPNFQQQLMSLLAIKLHTCLEVLDDITRLPIEVRLAKLLVHLQQQNNNNTIKMTQSDLASLLGVTVLSTHKAIKKLTKLMLIDSNYGCIVIKNIKQLSDWIDVNSALQEL